MEIRMVPSNFSRITTLCGILMLLQCILRPLQAASSGGGPVTTAAKSYAVYTHEVFENNGVYNVDYVNSERVCRAEGMNLATDHSEATNSLIYKLLKPKNELGYLYVYLGGDAKYSASSVHEEKDRCKVGDLASSLNCVYRWNTGLFAPATPDDNGVAFWRGSSHEVSGAGSMNDYPSFFKNYPAYGRLNVIAKLDSSDRVTWFDDDDDFGNNISFTNTRARSTRFFMVLCEASAVPTPLPPASPHSENTTADENTTVDGNTNADENTTADGNTNADENTTVDENTNTDEISNGSNEASDKTVPSTSSDGEGSGGGAGAAVVIIFILLVVLLVLLYFCCFAGHEKYITVMSLREKVTSPVSNVEAAEVAAVPSNGEEHLSITSHQQETPAADE
ncbi:hypothetical protein, conserved [Trypanosoma brucei gambiense DAL972]|uniref:T. brucei spp.-specific protein n=1 Tax=Trypanosoma brucei gambiense (strain MHOM/CI/86/DAL972) TaxID=679716 RepID=C9ZXA9_TRYB9|nr:hypothetical protein, conserved [Trypanosoma brucei gambiense DAL972]CBH14053.1 hypothetical protein, conserved [Trypanosoma brucei gambiense DAL972]|eukprot:XP_011776324.1 hypothetical protein, conserved [Trypanosoma brucei gambiense DAL972]